MWVLEIHLKRNKCLHQRAPSSQPRTINFCCCLGGDRTELVPHACRVGTLPSAVSLDTSTLRKFWDLQILPMIQSSQAQYYYIQEGNWPLFNKWCWETWMLTCKSELHPHYMQKFIQAKKELSYKILPQRHMNKPSLSGIW